jgi:hypothetical protein
LFQIPGRKENIPGQRQPSWNIGVDVVGINDQYPWRWFPWDHIQQNTYYIYLHYEGWYKIYDNRGKLPLPLFGDRKSGIKKRSNIKIEQGAERHGNNQRQQFSYKPENIAAIPVIIGTIKIKTGQ